MSPVPYSSLTPLLEPMASWCLDTFCDLAPLLIGVEFQATTVAFHPISLDPIDPVADVSGLRAPASWSAVVLVVDVLHARDSHGETLSGVLAHAATGDQAVTQLDSLCGGRSTLRRPSGLLSGVCAALFAGH